MMIIIHPRITSTYAAQVSAQRWFLGNVSFARQTCHQLFAFHHTIAEHSRGFDNTKSRTYCIASL